MATDRDILPDNVKPLNYNISLFDLQPSAPWTYQGRVEIDLQVKKAAKEITLNSLEIKVHSAELHAEAGKTASSLKASKISYDRKKQRCTLEFDQELQETEKAVLSITFEGTMNSDLAGFYRAKYKSLGQPPEDTPKDDEGFHYMFATQFESSDASRAFPCFDEPNLKASFDFEVEIPDGLVALSNMPEKETKKSKKSGHKIVSFGKTPVMSTYLLAWALGDLEYVEEFTGRKYNGESIPVRVYTSRGLKDQGKLALETSHKVVDLFSEMYQIDYPLPKLDLIAVPEFSSGAMENWGLITYRTTAVLFDEEKSDQKYRNRVAYVCAHELAHQWFGNLVTMDWWNELWLNEGFATWAGWYAVDKLYPEWNVFAQFVTDSMQTAFQLDSLRTSHPIEVPVRDALEVGQIFDAISYLKGSSVIRMLAGYLGEKTFLQGVADYLKKHQYGNATTNDLWSALSKASGQDVKAFMDPWILKIGFPVITVAEEPGQISVKQTRFLAAGDVKADEDETTWWIPLNLKTGPQATDAKREALTTKEDTYRDIDTSFYKVNADQTGFYRTNLPPQRLIELSKSLDKLSIQDKIGVVSDAAAMAVSGLGKTAALLVFTEGFAAETSYLVWTEVLNNLNKIRSVFSDDKQISEGMSEYVLKLVTAATEKIGWEFKPGEDYLTGQLRALLIKTAGLAGHEDVKTEAQKQFKAFIDGDKKAIHPSLRNPVFKIAVKYGGKDAYESVKSEYMTTTSVDGREICMAAMGQIQSAELANDYLDFAFESGHITLQDSFFPARALGSNAAVRLEVWAYTKEKWTMLRSHFGGNIILMERFLRAGLPSIADFKVEEDIQAFFKDKDNAGYDRALAVVCDSIVSNAKYRERDASAIKEWLSAHGYLA